MVPGAPDTIDWLTLTATAFFWIAALGLLWRRSLLGMLVGIFFGWISVAVAGIGFLGRSATNEHAAGAMVFVLCVTLVACLELVLGLTIVVARVARRGSLDAQEADLLEG